jgi:hypothetical protein
MAASTAEVMDDGCVTSSGRITSLVPTRDVRSSGAFDTERMVATTFHPREWKSFAMARPMPEFVPVMRTVWGIILGRFGLTKGQELE